MGQTICVGIDWASDHHDVAIVDERGTIQTTFRIDHSVEGLADLERRIQVAGGEGTIPSTVPIALERPDGLLVAALLERGYAVYPINPKAVDRYRDRHRQSGAKDDHRDARVLADILRTDRQIYRPMTPEGDVAAELRLTIRSYRELVAEATRLTNQVRACLSAYYPAALDLFPVIARPITLAFLAAFPTPTAAQAAGRSGLEAWFRSQKYPHLQRVEGMYAALRAPALTASAGEVRARSRQLQGLVTTLQAVIAAQKEHERALDTLLGQHPDGGLFHDLPGAGVVTAAALLGEMGEDRARFSTATDLQATSGTAPVTLQSGKMRKVVQRTRCNAHLQEAFHQFARCTFLQAQHGNPRLTWVKEVYAAARARGKTAQQAYRQIAHRWASILWAMWTRREPYDHTRYEQARQTRALPKAS